MNKISKIAAVLLLAMGVLLAMVAFFSNSNVPKNNQPLSAESAANTSKVQAVVAARDLPAGHLLTAEDVSLEHLPQMPPGGFASTSLVVGHSTSVEIAKNDVLTPLSLLDGLAGMLAAGERAVSIKVDEASAVGHKVRPGDWVDIFVVLRQDGKEVESTQARMLLPRKKVMAFGAKIQGEAKDEASKNKEPQSAVARTAVVAVQVEEVNRLLLAEQQGQVQLALRSPLDHNAPSADMLKQIPGISVRTVLNQDVSNETAAIDSSLMALKMADLGRDAKEAAASRAAKPPPGKPAVRKAGTTTAKGVPVEVIRGVHRDTVRY